MWSYNTEENGWLTRLPHDAHDAYRRRLMVEAEARRMQAEKVAETAWAVYTAAAGATRALGRALSRLLQPVVRWHAENRLYHELMSLDDRMLADIGVRRDEIRSAVKAVFQDAPAAGSATPANLNRGAERAA